MSTHHATRRTLLRLGLSTAGTAVVACGSPVSARPKRPSAGRSLSAVGLPLAVAPAAKPVVPLAFDASKFVGLSSKLLTLHHAKNYAGAVNKLNAIRRRLATADAADAGSYWSEYGTLKAGEAAARNSALLHELYFGNMLGGGSAVPAALAAALTSRFGSVEAMVAQMRGCAKATGGWVLLILDCTSNTLELVPTAGHAGGAWHAEALLVLDVYEHSYALDYGPNKSGYLDAFFRNLHWAEVGRRFEAAAASG